jgi:hypothetical protein
MSAQPGPSSCQSGPSSRQSKHAERKRVEKGYLLYDIQVSVEHRTHHAAAVLRGLPAAAMLLHRTCAAAPPQIHSMLTLHIPPSNSPSMSLRACQRCFSLASDST